MLINEAEKYDFHPFFRLKNGFFELFMKTIMKYAEFLGLKD